jgi:hypothetical protein
MTSPDYRTNGVRVQREVTVALKNKELIRVISLITLQMG